MRAIAGQVYLFTRRRRPRRASIVVTPGARLRTFRASTFLADSFTAAMR